MGPIDFNIVEKIIILWRTMGTINCPFKSKMMEILAAFPILQLFKKKIIRIYFIIYLLINL